MEPRSQTKFRSSQVHFLKAQFGPTGEKRPPLLFVAGQHRSPIDVISASVPASAHQALKTGVAVSRMADNMRKGGLTSD